MARHWLHRVLKPLFASHSLVKAKSRLSLEPLEAREVPAVFEVGPGLAYASVGAVPWNNITAGDTVRIHGRSEADGGDYHEKINISGQGTAANPIQILGVLGPNGERPVINGAGATTGPNNTTGYLGHQARGLITFSRSSSAQDFNFYKPQYIVIDGLEVENASPQYTFTNSAGVVTAYAQNAAAIYIERGSNIVIRNTEIHNSGNGFFAGSNDYATNGGDGGMIRDVLFEGNYVHDNGTPGGYSEHNIYTEGVNFTFQYNHLGPLLPTSGGANLKDRSAGTVIRYNSIEGGAHLLDLVHAQESASITTQLPSYRETFVYGNVMRDAPGPTGTMIHYGGDDYGNQQDFRKGTLYFFNNTVIIQDNQFGPGAAYQTVIFQLATNDESADIRNNVFYRSAAVGAPAGTAPTLLAFAANGENAGQYHMGRNWISPDWHAWYNDQAPAGGLFEGAANLITNAANNPGFVNLASYDLHLAANSPLIDLGQALAPAAAVNNNVTRQYVVPQSSEPRPVNGLAADLGAFEAGGSASTSPGQIQFVSSSVMVNEAAGTVTISVMRTGGSDGAVSVQFASSAGTAMAGQDYTAVAGTLQWAAGDTSTKTFTVPILDDGLVEANETVSFTLMSPTGGATLGSPASTTLTILDNDVAPSNGKLQISTNSFTVNEAAGTVTISVMRTGGSDGAVSVQYASGAGTATAGQDYTAVAGTLQWAAGDTSTKTFTVPIIDDGLIEGNESVSFTLMNPQGGAALGSPASATLTILDNDVFQAKPVFQFDAANYTVNENAGKVTITVTRTGGTAAASVQYRTYDRAGDPNVAWGESDYRVTSGKLTFAAGETTKTFTVAMIDDARVESSEVFGIALVNPSSGSTLGALKDATVTILENDTSLDFSQARFDVTEGAEFAMISVRRKGNTSGQVTVNYKMQSETAYAGQDFVSGSGQLVFAPGETVKTFTIRILNDGVKEKIEQLALQLINPNGGAMLGENIWSRLFIADDDVAAISAKPEVVF